MTSKDAINYVLERVNNTPKKPVVIAIDGCCASGKTTFASQLQALLDADVIHADDFYKPRDAFGKLNVSEYDGNFDIERYKNEIVSKLALKTELEYGVFDCKSQCISKRRIVKVTPSVICEGTYSLSPILGNYADIRIFFDISEDAQDERILMRENIVTYTMFKKIWIPAEKRYFDHYDVRSYCDIIVNV